MVRRRRSSSSVCGASKRGGLRDIVCDDSPPSTLTLVVSTTKLKIFAASGTKGGGRGVVVGRSVQAVIDHLEGLGDDEANTSLRRWFADLIPLGQMDLVKELLVARELKVDDVICAL